MESQQETNKLLQTCQEFHEQGDFERALELVQSPKAKGAPVDLLPYVLEMEVRCLMDLLQFQTALRILEESLKYLPNLRDFIFRKIKCLLALGRKDEAKTDLESLRKKILEDDGSEKSENPKEAEWRLADDSGPTAAGPR
jgi:tetratricopeptide (TPR) repeat protein